MPLGPLPADIGSQLLFKIYEKTPKDGLEESTAHEISTWVGGLPVAIVTLAGYMKGSSSSPAELFASLKRSSKSWRRQHPELRLDLAIVFNIALGELSENARHLVDFLAYLNLDHVSEELLTSPHSLPTL